MTVFDSEFGSRQRITGLRVDPVIGTVSQHFKRNDLRGAVVKLPESVMGTDRHMGAVDGQFRQGKRTDFELHRH